MLSSTPVLATLLLVIFIASAPLISGLPANTVSVQQDGGGQNCVIVNDMVTDNGVQRPLTSAEREQLRRYNEAWQQWMDKKMDGKFNKFEKKMDGKFKKMEGKFGSNSGEAEVSAEDSSSTATAPEKPQFPCICSGCAQPASS